MSLSLNLESIILLLFFIAPGFLFTRTYSAYRPRYYREPSAFEQSILAVIGSTVIHAALLTVVAALVLGHWVATGQLLYFENLIDLSAPLGDYSLPAIALFLFIGTFYLSLSLIAARRFATFLGQSVAARPRWWKLTLGPDPPEPFLLWHTVLQIEPYRLDLIPPYLHIQMRSGEYFEGELYQLRLVGDEENSVELALRSVHYSPTTPSIQARGGALSQGLQSLTDQVVLLKSSDIRWLTRNDIPQTSSIDQEL